MTRRHFFALGPLCAGCRKPLQNTAAATVPVFRAVDSAAQYAPELLDRFWLKIWPEAFREFQIAGIQLQTTDGTCEVRRTAGSRPILKGLRRGAINLLLTDHIPPYWDDGRSLAGVSAIYEGYHFCMIALRNAHPNRVPFLSINTCVHELLHVLLKDIFVSRPKWYQSSDRELRIDAYATRLWLFHDGTEIRKSAVSYVTSIKGAVLVKPFRAIETAAEAWVKS